jgi:hypothetical protein
LTTAIAGEGEPDLPWQLAPEDVVTRRGSSARWARRTPVFLRRKIASLRPKKAAQDGSFAVNESLPCKRERIRI